VGGSRGAGGVEVSRCLGACCVCVGGGGGGVHAQAPGMQPRAPSMQLRGVGLFVAQQHAACSSCQGAAKKKYKGVADSLRPPPQPCQAPLTTSRFFS